MKMNKVVAYLVVALALTSGVAVTQAQAEQTDIAQLQGIGKCQAVFDLNVSDPMKLSMYLMVIKQTNASFIANGVKPELVVSVRGASVMFISGARPGMTPEQQMLMTRIANQIAELDSLGVRFEGCAIAMGLMNVDPSGVIPQVSIVQNTLLTLIAYQTKGFSVVPCT
jgi:intracellular sulfur oxidation DsrE/DsrF family protein